MEIAVEYNQINDVKIKHRQLVEACYGCPIGELEIESVNNLLNSLLPELRKHKFFSENYG